ncbi:hypothetical protein F11_03230 [Rhodospirillum rubrum F11]|uniref:Uncharacterized protein n=1 Tax=Rhodospirillum rubrum (strain ATCC 11170 / ATH 1.1.1 / DSM 467 / LMG 4362 / NCIMB 8255 / S1) TaxID=269796 RepID=Q2RWR1_RHORT|nr:hypothetical protein Rru_A0630 [Rhodospirillum rubrum ATCC 11170]AEO47116.1 hypothetical protein F11_03230 [Rhodospirillum rubrum F11]MBK5953028.1 hypothetical protein [Rhodospirillum rubrum]QXG82329.1 hypothetical protein KUL73_03275 [Rhodospirillum rubrum]HAP99222.1 hypothetical protein [Rhodospirillum rubrum]
MGRGARWAVARVLVFVRQQGSAAVESLFATGRVIDAILVLMILEVVALVFWHRLTGRGIAPRQLLGVIAAGAALMIALRSALTGAPWTETALWLSLGLIAHLGDLALRWRGGHSRLR